jgi:lysozyme family protein
MWKWIKKLFRRQSDDIQVTIPPIINPEPPTKEEVDNFPKASLDENRISEVMDVCKKYLANKDAYLSVSKATSVPSELVFALHYRESSLRFNGVLHNGENIIGTGRLTKLVPKGRGPFSSWEEAAVDALEMKRKIFPQVWNFESMCDFAERYNGLGYRNRGELSPYVWAGTNKHDETGKYISDGKYSSTAIEKQLGVAALLIGLSK